MANAKLSREHAIALLHKLATDQSFRDHFEKDPSAALGQMGVPEDVIANLRPESVRPAKLAPPGEFHRAWRQLADESAEARLSMIVPHLRLDFGDNDRQS